jgi:HD-GYP domain-containing protein (c-di-GMP phosphodiesterase class II)
MRLVRLDQIRAGDRLARDVQPDPSALPLLRTGVRMSPSYVAALRRAGIAYVYVDDELSRGIDPRPVLTEETRRRAAQTVSAAFRDAAATLGSTRAIGKETMADIEAIVRRIAADIAAAGDAAIALNDLASADAYTLKHSMGVTTLGLALGQRVLHRQGWVDYLGKRRFDELERRLTILGVGLMLHDVGKLAVPMEILNKPGRLDPAEWEAMRRHPAAGYDMIRNAPGISPVSLAVIRSHHERWDGDGYPERRAGEDIPHFARIASIADVYDAVTSERPYRPASPVHEGVRIVLEGAGAAHDPDLVAMFRHVVAPFPPGEAVELSDGSRGIVAWVPLGAFDRPVVRVVHGPHGAPVDPHEVDLGAAPGLDVVAVGVELRPDPAAADAGRP